MSEASENALANHPIELFNPKIDTTIEEANQLIRKEWNEKGILLVKSYTQMMHLAQTSNQPTEILVALRESVDRGQHLAKFFDHLAIQTDEVMSRVLVTRDNDSKQPIAALQNKKHYHESERDAANVKGNAAAAAAGAAIAAAPLTAGLSLLFAPAPALTAASLYDLANTEQKTLDGIESDIKRIIGHIELARKEKGDLPQKMASNREILAFSPLVMSYRYGHALNIYKDADKYASQHGTTTDKVAEFLKKESHKCSESYLALIRGDYREDDLRILEQYAMNATITVSPEQRAFLQFINHAVLPRQDYFEIWASKMHDLEQAQHKIQEAFAANTPEARPALELFKERSISLSGKIKSLPVSKEPSISNDLSDGHKRATQDVLTTATDAQNVVQTIQDILNDQTKTLQARHQEVLDKAREKLIEFNKFFGGIDAQLANIEKQFPQAARNRDRVEIKWERAESNATQKELLGVRDPASRHAHNTAVNIGSIAAGGAMDAALVWLGVPPVSTVSMVSRVIQNEVKNYGARVREDLEHAILMRSMENRNRMSPEAVAKLKLELDALDAQVNELSKKQEFLTFLSNNPMLENVRAAYTLLPRLIAGENNIDAIELKTKKAGYNRIDDFLADLCSDNPRLADAMQNFLLGLANTNDLKIILAEANAIVEPNSPKEKVLVGYVEEIKEDYPDCARQASIVDYLEMRNVIATGKSFHSFGEIVKRETDSALQALLAGKGDFSLVGSNDVHQIFGYYQTRHGEDCFKDIHDPNKWGPKRAYPADPEEIRSKHRHASDTRTADTKIPRISSVFTEIFAFEYLLTQGTNIGKDRDLASNPNALGALEMVNNVAQQFIQKLALDTARLQKRSDSKQNHEIGREVECLIALSFVDFFSELGARHSANSGIADMIRKVRNAYSGENFSRASRNYTTVISEDAQESYGLFLEVYQRNLEKYLECATRDNKKALLTQLANVKDIMKDIQPTVNIIMPESEAARLKAHYRNNSLSNVGHNHSTWVIRTESIQRSDRGKT